MKNIGQWHIIDFFISKIFGYNKETIDAQFPAHYKNIAVDELIAEIPDIAFFFGFR